MIYRKSECCITPDELLSEDIKTDGYYGERHYEMKKDDDDCCREMTCPNENLSRRLSELQFAAIDLNLYLDTHPCDEEALAMFKKVCKTLESAKYDYVKKYGPLKAGDSSDKMPFEWASDEYKWPWEK